MKKILATALLLTMLFSLNAGVLAAEETINDEEELIWIDTTDIDQNISLYSAVTVKQKAPFIGTSSYGITVGISKSAKISVSVTLQKKTTSGSWKNVSSFSSSYTGTIKKFSKSYSASKGTYRCSCKLTVGGKTYSGISTTKTIK